MKTIKIFSGIVMIMLLSVKSLIAGTDPTTNDNMMYNEIKKIIIYPEQARIEKIEGFVLVSFTITKEGVVNITGMNGSSTYLKNYVEEQLKGLQFTAGDSEKTYNVRFNFQLLKE
jgi:TonB family protein